MVTISGEIDKLKNECNEKLNLAERLSRLVKEYPDLEKRSGRWNKEVYASKTVNGRVDQYETRYNCGCCGDDSPLEVWPYIETPDGRVYSNPPYFFVANRGGVERKGWKQDMQKAGISESIIQKFDGRYTKCEEVADLDEEI